MDIALALRDQDQVRIVVVSEGLGAKFLKKKREEFKLDNLIILDFQPFESVPEVMGTADILIAILDKDAGVFSVPSKVLTYHCAAGHYCCQFLKRIFLLVLSKRWRPG